MALSSPGSDELATQAALDQLTQEQANIDQAKALGLEKISEQPIELGFITGQQAATERRATNLETGLEAQQLPLKEQLAREQAQRQAALDVASKTFEAQQAQALQAESEASAQQIAQTKADALKNVPAGASLYDPSTGEIIATGAPKSTTDQLNYQAAQASGYTGSFTDYLADKTLGFMGGSDPSGVSSINSLAQAVLSGQLAPSQIPTGSRGAIRTSVENAVLAQNPSFNFASAESSFQFGKSTPVIQQVAKIQGLIGPGGALDQLQALSNSIPRTQFPNLNQLTLAAAEATGSPEVATYLSQAKLVGDEIGNALAASGASDLKVQLGLDMDNPNLTIAQMNAVLQGAAKQLQSRSEAYTNASPSIPVNTNYGSQTSPTPGGTYDW